MYNYTLRYFSKTLSWWKSPWRLLGSPCPVEHRLHDHPRAIRNLLPVLVTTRRSKPTSPMMNISIDICLEVCYLLAWSSAMILVSAGEKQQNMPQPCCHLTAQPRSPRGMGFVPGDKGAHGHPDAWVPPALSTAAATWSNRSKGWSILLVSNLIPTPINVSLSSVHKNALFAHLRPIYCFTI